MVCHCLFLTITLWSLSEQILAVLVRYLSNAYLRPSHHNSAFHLFNTTLCNDLFFYACNKFWFYFRFIGELFLIQMLTSKIMHQCLHSLLKAGDEASLEFFCKLWTTIGKAFDANAQARVSTVQCGCLYLL